MQSDWRETQRRFYDSTAGRYGAHFEQANPYFRFVLERFLETLAPRSGERILELGCSGGRFTLPLLERGFRIHAVELGENLAALLFVGGVDIEVLRLATQLLDVPPDFRYVLEARLAVEVHTNDVVTRLRERAGSALAEAARRSEDERPFRSLHLRVWGIGHGGIIASIQ